MGGVADVFYVEASVVEEPGRWIEALRTVIGSWLTIRAFLLVPFNVVSGRGQGLRLL
jgi:hypothetical protein